MPVANKSTKPTLVLGIRDASLAEMTNIADIDLDAVETLARAAYGGAGDRYMLDLVSRVRSCHAGTERLAILARIAVILPLVSRTYAVPMTGGRMVVLEAADYPPVEDDLIE